MLPALLFFLKVSIVLVKDAIICNKSRNVIFTLWGILFYYVCGISQ